MATTLSSVIVFAVSLLVGGALGCGFVAATWPRTTHPVRRGALVVLFLALLFMGLVGAFPLPTAPHGLVAVLFFVLLTVGVATWGAGDLAAGRPARGLALVVGCVLHVVSWFWWALYDWPGEGVAVPELVGAATLAVWALWVAADSLADERSEPSTARRGRRRRRSRR